MREEEISVEGSEEASERSDEYYESEEEELESKELSLSEVEVFIERGELWDKMALGEIPVDKGVELHKQILAKMPTPATTVSRRRRRRK